MSQAAYTLSRSHLCSTRLDEIDFWTRGLSCIGPEQIERDKARESRQSCCSVSRRGASCFIITHSDRGNQTVSRVRLTCNVDGILPKGYCHPETIASESDLFWGWVTWVDG